MSFMVGFVILVSGCGEKQPYQIDKSAGLTDETFKPVPVYDGPVNSIGTLTQGYIQNTEGLLTANSRLTTLCIAYGKCEKEL